MQPAAINVVAAIRASTAKQGFDGDSPEAQTEIIDRFAEQRGYVVTKYFKLLESGYKQHQPMQEVIDYCKNPENNVQKVIIKSIDRFTRGGSDLYGPLKRQLEDCGVELVDVFGIINPNKVNTLEHTGFKYKWSVYSPSKKSEILEAERANDEMRDIMTRMVGAEIRYTQLGFWMRQPPIGTTSKRVDTENGKRFILVPDERESIWMIRMFELRAMGVLNDGQIAEEINKLGFQTRKSFVRDKTDHMTIVRERGGRQLTAKMVSKYIQNPIYAGIIQEKWTNNEPVKAKFDGLISIDLFNRANKGKRTIVVHADGKITIFKKKPPAHLVHKNLNNPEFPYKRIVHCPQCHGNLLGSASRGKLGKYYPAYHCSNYGHYFRVPKAKFEEQIEQFTKRIVIAPERLDEVLNAILASWEGREKQAKENAEVIEIRRKELETQIRLVVDKMRLVSSQTAIKYMEEDIAKYERELEELNNVEVEEINEKSIDIPRILTYVKYFVEHLEDLLLHHCNPINRAAYFGVLFDKVPTYETIADGTRKIAHIPEVNELFRVCFNDIPNLVTLPGIEPGLPG